MSKVEKSLSDMFNLDAMLPPEVIEAQPVEPEQSRDVVDDSEFARKNIRELLEKGGVAMERLMAVAKESEKSRDYEVLGTLIKNLSDLNKDLMEIHKKEKELTPLNGGQQKKLGNGVNVDKAIFVGTTTELVKLLKEKPQE
jgi:hypothetical protein